MEIIGKIVDPNVQLPPSEVSNVEDAGTFVITKFEFSIETTVRMGGQSGGPGAGKAQLKPIIITRPIGAMSATFMTSLVRGRHFESLMIKINDVTTTKTSTRSTTKKPSSRTTSKPFQHYTFVFVVISNFKHFTDAEGQLMEEVHFNYGTLQLENIKSQTSAEWTATPAKLPSGASE